MYLAEDLQSSLNLVAIKVLRNDLIEDPHAVSFFRREGAILQELNHPNIVGFKNYIEEEGHYYLVLEYILGPNLSSFNGSVKLSARIKLALAILCQLVDALEYLEIYFSKMDKLFLHGDICPSNIMIDQFGTLKLLDFDTARIETTSSTPATKVRGRLKYLSPELLRGEPADTRSDIFVVGLLMYELLLGHSVFASFSIASINERLGSDEEFDETPLKILPSDIQRIVAACIKKDPAARPSSFAALKHAIMDSSLRYAIENPQKTLREYTVSCLEITWKKRMRDWLKVRINPIVSYSVVALFALLTLYGAVASKEYLATLQPLADNKSSCEENIVMETPANHHYISKNEQQQNLKGVLSVQAKPWAKVFVNADYRGITPLNALSLTPGKYIVELKNPNFSTVVLRHVTIYADKKSSIHYDFLEEE